MREKAVTMRKALVFAFGALLLAVPICSRAQQQSVAEAARKSREQKKQKPAKVFTNDDLAALSGGVSVVGNETPTEKETAPAEAKIATPTDKDKEKGEKAEVKDEAYW